MGKGEGKGWSIEYRLPSIEEIEGDSSFIDDVLEYADSPEGLLYSEVSDTVSEVLERADVDAKERQIIWEDGQRLSIAASAQRIEAEYPGYPLDLIEERVVEWLCDMRGDSFGVEIFAAKEMREVPSESAGRGRFQTTSSCCGQEPWW